MFKLSAISRQRLAGGERSEAGGRSARGRRSPFAAPRSLPGTLWVARRSSLVARRSSRRGVLLLVVLSMLVLFMLIGTAFLMSSNSANRSAKVNAKKDRLGNHATRLLDRAAVTVIRDTDDPNSALRYHSLLRDLYGTDGFQAVCYSDQRFPFDPTIPAQQVTRFAGANAAQLLGPTNGQFIDIYVRALAFNADDPLTSSINETLPPLTSPDLRHVVKLDRNGLNQPQLHALPLTKGYYNGCLLTITSGPAAGQSTRILDYEYLADIGPNLTNPARSTRLFRFRVMAFPRADGQPLQINQTAARSPEIADLAGATILVNGRAFSGTGVGYNPLAAVGTPRLNALQIVPLLSSGGTEFLGEEIALTPNSRYVFDNVSGAIGALMVPPGDPYGITHPPGDFALLNTTTGTNPKVISFKYGWFPGPGGGNEDYDAVDFQNMILALQTVTPRARGRVVTSSGTYEIDGGTLRGTYPGTFLRLDLEDVPLPTLHRPDLVNFWFHRMLNSQWLSDEIPDADDRVRAILQPYDPTTGNLSPGVSAQVAAQITALKRKIIVRPLREDHPKFNGSNTLSATQLPTGALVDQPSETFITVPYWEVVGPWDVDNDNDGVADSIWVDLGDPIQEAEDGTRYRTLYALLVMDLDGRLNVNAHGLVDHIKPENLAPYNNLAGTGGFGATATQYNTNQLAPGSGYSPAEISLRPVFPAPLNAAGVPVEGNRIEDTDGNGTINAADTPVDSYATVLAGRSKLGFEGIPGKLGFQPLPAPGMQYPFEAVAPGLNYRTDNTTGYDRLPEPATEIKHFNYPINIGFRTAFGTPPDLFGRYPMGLGYDGQPVYEVLYDGNAAQPLLPRSLLVDAPIELNLSSRQRRDSWNASFAVPLDEFNQSLVQNDDAPFATTDLERVLRAFDANVGMLPSRLWDVVDPFDPVKLMTFDPYRVTAVASAAFGVANPQEPERLAAAQQIAAINRRLVTTDSFDLPVPGGGVPNPLILSLGADGAPGRLNVDDDNDDSSNPDEADELNAPISDDFRALYGKDAAQATIFDLLRYRVWVEARKYETTVNTAWDTPAELRALSPAQYTAFLTQVSTRAELMLNGEPFNDADGDGVVDAGEFVVGTHDRNGNRAFDGPIAQLLAPEVVAGLRMDVNRPFGDGRDNGDGFDNDGNGLIDDSYGLETGPMATNPGPDLVMNGAVDDALEAGEPFLDVNRNGKLDNGEPFIDLDGDNVPTRAIDQLWVNVGMAEPIAFDYTNGQGVTIHPTVAARVPVSPSANVRSLESEARQLYARHLYCLMLLLMDEGYIAPVDENDPQIKEYLDTTVTGSIAANILAAFGTDPNAAAYTRQVLLRKLTCRMIAQWAVNAVDMRDADATMTPFEYDEYPWDGWGVPLRNPATTAGPIASVIPLDGDAATDENAGAVIDWKEVIASNGQKVVAPSPDGTTIPAIVPAPLPLDQTRGMVWGAERPELLISETLAFHDRRTEDLESDLTQKLMRNEGKAGVDGDIADMDQRLRPRGSVFVELLNPWSPTGQYPAEVYSKAVDLNKDGGRIDVIESPGIEMGRLSTLGIAVDNTGRSLGRVRMEVDAPTVTTPTVKRSPVWRMIVVEEEPKYRNTDPVDDQPNPYGAAVHTGNTSKYRTPGAGSFFSPVDPDFRSRYFFGQEMPSSPGKFKANEPYVERSFYFTSDNSARFKRGLSGSVAPTERNAFFTLVEDPDKKLRLPPETTQSARYFIAGDIQTDPTIATSSNTDVIPDVLIAPIKPGRYAIVGSAGAQYRDETRYLTGTAQGFAPDGVTPITVSNVPRFVTTVSRRGAAADTERADDNTRSNLGRTRRIELLPHPNPDVQQFLVGANGGTPLYPTGARLTHRDNEVVKLPTNPPEFRNIFDGDDDDLPDTQLIPPCVVIPVMNMSVSEPLDVYAKRRGELDTMEREQNLNSPPPPNALRLVSHVWNPEAAWGEGAYTQEANGVGQSVSTYDTPFDTAPELVRNGTTRNYRTIHLQRLADPNLPWNPLPTLPDGKPNAQHDPRLPVNVYFTIDSASVDLTAFNGASNREPDDPNHTYVLDNGRSLPDKVRADFNAVFGRSQTARFGSGAGKPPHRLSFRSRERGAHNFATTAAGNLPLVPRNLWRQEPETRYDPTDDSNVKDTNDMAMWFNALSSDDQRRVELVKRANDLRIRDRNEFDKDVTAITNVLDPDFRNLPAKLRPGGGFTLGHQFDVIMKHSLGFQNEAFGALTTTEDADPAQQNLPPAAVGTPMKDQANGPNEKFSRTVGNNDATLSAFPWLAWNNRPLVSAEELLQVPATSSSQMLRRYSTIHPNVVPPNPYDGSKNDLAHLLSPFGYLLNYFLTSQSIAGYGPDVNDIDGDMNTTELVATGAPHFYRILDFVHVPSRFVGTDDMLTAEIFNDVPGVMDVNTGGDITGPSDPRYYFQPPFNKVSRERDPGQVNLNTVTARRIPGVWNGEVSNSTPPRIWSEVFDGIMQRDRDGNLPATGGNPARLGHGGPAWRDVVLSRRGYAQNDAAGELVDKPPATKNPGRYPDALQFGLNPLFPTFFSNPFRSANSGDLVPIPQMLHYGIDTSWMRGHHYNRGPRAWGQTNVDDNGDGSTDDIREAGFGNGDNLAENNVTGELIPPNEWNDRGIYPLFSETFSAPYIDGERNPYFYYQPMTRLGNLVTNRSNVYAVWITVGYFEVEPAPSWSDITVQQRFGGDGSTGSPATVAALALYNRVYPDGYMLGKELGSDTGDTHRHRGFYIVDRSEPVGFKPGEDLNVERTIRLRRRVE